MLEASKVVNQKQNLREIFWFENVYKICTFLNYFKLISQKSYAKFSYAINIQFFCMDGSSTVCRHKFFTNLHFCSWYLTCHLNVMTSADLQGGSGVHEWLAIYCYVLIIFHCMNITHSVQIWVKIIRLYQFDRFSTLEHRKQLLQWKTNNDCYY